MIDIKKESIKLEYMVFTPKLDPIKMNPIINKIIFNTSIIAPTFNTGI